MCEVPREPVSIVKVQLLKLEAPYMMETAVTRGYL